MLAVVGPVLLAQVPDWKQTNTRDFENMCSGVSPVNKSTFIPRRF